VPVVEEHSVGRRRGDDRDGRQAEQDPARCTPDTRSRPRGTNPHASLTCLLSPAAFAAAGLVIFRLSSRIRYAWALGPWQQPVFRRD